jgi:hypothetical protein
MSEMQFDERAQRMPATTVFDGIIDLGIRYVNEATLLALWSK